MWGLRYDEAAFDFGAVNVARVQIAGISYTVSDIPAPRDDGTWFGQDTAEPGDILLSLSVGAAPGLDDAAARRQVFAIAEEFSRHWDAPQLREKPRAVAEFYADELGMFEGRPRSVEWDFSKYSAGWLTGRTRFVRSSLVSHPVDGAGEALWRSVEAALTAPPSRSGWVFPLVFPLQNLEPVVLANWFEVGGDAPAWPVIEISGPLQAGASLEVSGAWQIRLARDLAYDQTSTIDTRPGRRVSTINGTPVIVLAPDSTRLSELSLSPGPHQVSLRGISPQGTAHARVRWRDTKAGI